jgi:ubiquinone/menaquinone biosynthesis C-methylase UbiE
MFTVAADAYDSFMGKFSVQLAPALCDFAGVHEGRAVDVGCGPGALTTELVRRLGAEHVSAADPSEPFVEAARDRHPGVDVRLAPAESLPFADGEFDAALAQLVVHFMSDPVVGMRELKRVTRPGGVVATCVWDHGGGQGPLSPFWAAVHDLAPQQENEAGLMGSRQGQLVELFEQVGFDEIEETALPASVAHATFDEWWEPFTFGVGPAGAYVTRLDDTERERTREACHRLLGDTPVVTARAWTVRGIA